MKKKLLVADGFALVECLMAIALLAIAFGVLARSQQAALRFAKTSELELKKQLSARSAIASYLANERSTNSREIFTVQNSTILGSISCQPLSVEFESQRLLRCSISYSNAPKEVKYFVQ